MARSEFAAEPYLNISLSGSRAQDFHFEELTVNPYFRASGSAQPPRCDLWIECLIRHSGSQEIGVNELPALDIHLRDFERSAIKPHTALSGDNGELLDLNTLLYSEIWASFVPAYDGRGDFMKTGYRLSNRIVGVDLDMREIAKALEAGSVPTSGISLWAAVADLRNCLLLFHEVMNRNVSRSVSSLDVPEGLGYKGTSIDVANSVPSGALAFRRAPWSAKDATVKANPFKGTIYPAFVHTQELGQGWMATTKPIVSSNVAGNARLKPNEAYCFWMVFYNVNLTRPNPHRNAFAFEIELRSETRVSHLNVFFRMPHRYQYDEGGLTTLKRYPTPPKLFALWDEFNDCDCYIAEDEPGTQFPKRLNADFRYSAAETDKIQLLFVLGLIFNLFISLSINFFTSAAVFIDKPPTTIFIEAMKGRIPLAISTVLLFMVAIFASVVTFGVYLNRFKAPYLIYVFFAAALVTMIGLGLSLLGSGLTT